MVKINKIYTRTGDDGTTGLVGGARIEKDSPRVGSYGDVDELNAWLGVCRTIAGESGPVMLCDYLAQLQNELFDLGAELATPPGAQWEGQLLMTPSHAERLERQIDELNASLPELRSFVLPGGCELNAFLHVGRTVCRRAERSVISLSREEPVSPHIVVYLNRLSDLLFAMARYASHHGKATEYLWKPGARLPGTPSTGQE